MSMSISGMGGAWSPQAMSGASMAMSPTQKMTNAYQQIDTAKSGSITGQQFSQAFNGLNPPAAFKAMGTSAIFSQLDPNGTGSVSQKDFVSGMTSLMSKARHHHHAGSGATTSTTSGTTPASPAQTLASSAQSLGSISGQTTAASTTGSGSLINTVL